MTNADRASLSPATHTADDVVRLLQMAPLPGEGGWFRRTSEGDDTGNTGGEGASRAFAVIYALFTPAEFSALHRLTVDEVWCFHAGDPLQLVHLPVNGPGERLELSLNVAAGERPQVLVRAGVWQGARLRAGGRWALVSCVTVPGFTWEGFTLGQPDELAALYPGFAEDIRQLTRGR